MYWIHLLLVLAPLTNSLTCNKPVGIEDRTIPDQSFQASSEYSRFQAASEARLNNVKRADIGEGAWCAKMYGDELKYLQVDLGSVRKLGYVLIQGRNTTYPQYVTQFRVSVSTLGRVFAILSDPLSPGTPKLFAGNKDKNTVVKVDIRKGPLSTVTARYIRIYITKFYANPCMRIELLECQATVTTTAAPVSSTAAPVPSTAANSTTTVVPFCPDGHRLGKDNKTCVDIDECSEGSKCDPYSTTCNNTKGSFTCQCKTGFKESISSKYRCTDIDECAGPSPTARCNLTSTSCSNTDGGFKCVCKKGYKRQDPLTCVDIDECAGPSPIARCDLTSTSCSNTVGGFKCVCKKGYKRQDPLTCVDKDECINGESLCSLQSTQCVNRQGFYICICKSGYQRNDEQKASMPYRCLDIDECSNKKGGCSHDCQNLNGTFRCYCPVGLEIKQDDEHNCKDINECLLAKGGCEQFCHNTYGSYSCSCRNGFKPVRKYKCADIDECADNLSLCDGPSTICRNNQPLYQCDCKPGFIPISGNIHKCKPLTCPELTQSVGTIISPSTCTQPGVPKFNDVCTYSCAAGYEKPASYGTTLTCQTSGSWVGKVTQCVRRPCPALTAPSNGKVWPDFCQTKGNYFEYKCHYRCNNNFNAVGDVTRTCQADGSWNRPTKPFSCQAVQPKPTITCPLPVTVILQTGESTADVSALLDKPKSNVKTITVSPAKYQTTSVYSAGYTVLTYTATNPLGQTVSCKTTVSVLDDEKPKVTGCPADIYQVVTGNSKRVTWTPPEFTDNVGIAKSASSKNPGDVFYTQSPLVVYYRGFDAVGNSVSCSFQVTLKKAECPAAPRTPNGAKPLAIYEYNGVKYTSIRCNTGKELFWSVWGVSCSAMTSLKWDPIPDCVDHKPMPASGVCDQGYVKQANGKNICVKCPLGYSYDSAKKACNKCAIGSYSVSEGSLSCKACPVNQGTLEIGSTSCSPKCWPGKASIDGYTSCKGCRQGFYEDRYGSTACKACPKGMSTLSTGSSSLSDCGGKPSITEFKIQPNNVTEHQPTEIVCKGTGVPLPSFTIKKIKPTPDGFGGPVTKASIKDNLGRIVGIRYSISKTTEHDAGTYQCQLKNKFGKTEHYLKLHIELVYVPVVGRR